MAASPKLKISRNALLFAFIVFAGVSLFGGSQFLAFLPLSVVYLVLAIKRDKTLKASPLLILNEEGLAWYTQPSHIIRWGDIERIESKKNTVHIRLKDRAFWLYPFGKKGLNIKTSHLEAPHDDVYAAIMKRFKAYAPFEAGPEMYE